MKNIREILTLARNLKKQRIVVAAAEDEQVIIAVNSVLDLGLCDPILIGNKEAIEAILVAKKFNKDKYTIYHTNSDEDSAKLAVKLIKEDKGDILMKGLIETKVLLKAVIDKEEGIRVGNLLSHITVISHPSLKRLVFATDCAMTLYPTVEQKIDIIDNAVELLHMLGYEEPKVGIISAVEKVNPKLISSYDALAIKAHYDKLPNKKYIVDGPFAVDNAISIQAAQFKKMTSPIAGKVDIFLFPNLDSGNTFYKTSVFLAGAEAAGIIVGAKVPIVLTSRADAAIMKLYSIALAGVYQHGKNTRH